MLPKNQKIYLIEIDEHTKYAFQLLKKFFTLIKLRGDDEQEN
jgi:hypothetical protein